MDVKEDIVKVELTLSVEGKYDFYSLKRYKVPLEIARAIEGLLLKAEGELLALTSRK